MSDLNDSNPNDSESPTLEALARRYLELWQDQWAAVAADPVTTENVTRWFQIMAQGASLFTPFGNAVGGPGFGWDPRPSPVTPSPQDSPWPFVPRDSSVRPWFSEGPIAAARATSGEPTKAGAGNEFASAADASTPGAAPSASASGDLSDGAAQFARRLALLERRFTALEAGATRPRFRTRRPDRCG
jgi:hypothetical protein